MKHADQIETTDVQGLGRFLSAQERDFETALTEISYGKKLTDWMWYIFPQIQGLGFSETAKFYAITDLKEATQYLSNAVLGPRLGTISKELLKHKETSAGEIFGSPDDMKLRSCMTLFSAVPGADPVFQQVLDQFFSGDRDAKTERVLRLQSMGD